MYIDIKKLANSGKSIKVKTTSKNGIPNLIEIHVLLSQTIFIKLRLTRHAVQRLEERFPNVKIKGLCRILSNSSIIESRESALSLMDHDYEEALYAVHKDASFCAVIIAGTNVIKTFYKISESHWLKKWLLRNDISRAGKLGDSRYFNDYCHKLIPRTESHKTSNGQVSAVALLPAKKRKRRKSIRKGTYELIQAQRKQRLDVKQLRSYRRWRPIHPLDVFSAKKIKTKP